MNIQKAMRAVDYVKSHSFNADLHFGGDRDAYTVRVHIPVCDTRHGTWYDEVIECSSFADVRAALGY
jgi:hypothetical protein